ncbi:MAG: FKBP-type peptidyl-prolyl cis-trans isomerase [Lysobacteraceae bacterium]|nr:MAG: FKBP-type peptidyl-prolyl cis-trans isomerase [Xanthomonadaceae bacterium]
MKLRLLAAATLVAMTLATGAVAAQDTTSEKGKLSYAIGYKTGIDLAQLMASGEQVDINTVIKALQDAVARKDPAVPADQLRTAIQNMQKRQIAKAKAEFEKLAAENKTKSDAFMAQNKAKSGVKTLPSGVQYKVIEAGGGAKPVQASQVTIEYKGTLPDGRVIIDTAQAGPNQPAGPVPIKVSEVPLAGLREALLMMPTGARWEVAIPGGDKGYGSGPEAGEMANQAVIFNLKLVSIQK